jgi:hypothetical protein
MQLLLVLFLVQRDFLLPLFSSGKISIVFLVPSLVRPSIVIFVLGPKAPYAIVVVIGP